MQNHAIQAERIKYIIEIVKEIQKETWSGYPKSSKLNLRLDSAEKALSKVRSELEERFYWDHPDAANFCGFPHYNFDSLQKLRKIAQESEVNDE